ncbi:MAG: hypothetical protein AAF637_02950 [Pseudomonadota bacterium]
MQRWILAGLIMAAAQTAVAQTYPDIRGTWTGTADAVHTDVAAFEQQGASAVQFNTLPVELVIDQQQGRRFAGTIKFRHSPKPLVGIFLDSDDLLWSEPDGRVEAELEDRNTTLEYCYLGGTEAHVNASCAVLKRQN